MPLPEQEVDFATEPSLGLTVLGFAGHGGDAPGCGPPHGCMT
jgi:hypothetical protein